MKKNTILPLQNFKYCNCYQLFTFCWEIHQTVLSLERNSVVFLNFELYWIGVEFGQAGVKLKILMLHFGRYV